MTILVNSSIRSVCHYKSYHNDIKYHTTLDTIFGVTSHTRLKVHDHCILSFLMEQKGWDPPSSLHTRRWQRKDPHKWSWMRSLHEFLHDKLYIMFHEYSKVCIRPDTNSSKPCQHYDLWMGIKRPSHLHSLGPWLVREAASHVAPHNPLACAQEGWRPLHPKFPLEMKRMRPSEFTSH